MMTTVLGLLSTLKQNRRKIIMKNITFDKNAAILEINSNISIVNFSSYAEISFKNNTAKKISAVKLVARGYNIFEDIVYVNNSSMFDIILENLQVDAFSYSLPKQILLPDNSIVKIKIAELKVLFSDGSTSLYDDKNIIGII